MKITVIGGGASGLVASIMAAKNGNEVILLEKNKMCGKKILITGNGKCNYWNEYQDIECYQSSNPEYIEKIIKSNNLNSIMEFFKSIGIVPKVKNGYYYPQSNQATSVQTALIKEAKLSGVNIIYEEVVKDIEYKNKFTIKTNNNTYIADKVILATGSKACSKTGSDGIGYILAQKLGHSIIEPLPALVQLKSNDKFLKEWSGIRTEVDVNLYIDDNLIKQEYGEIQLTDYGVSGICIFQLSRYVSKCLNDNKKIYLTINFLPFIKEKEVTVFMNMRNNNVKNRTISELLDGILNYKLVNLILKVSNIDRDDKWDNLTDGEKESLIENLISFKVNITGTNSFEQAQTCTGGIPLNEMNIETMESLKQKGLYITGELLDVDGDCGGYNLSFAWITGYLAGSSIKETK